ncbi:Hypothetical protein D9617_2g052050 [Elsinoe fawcettii]|nr:Hypothetical protein D9617_2g052050 [Elsinoe fawcettii]
MNLRQFSGIELVCDWDGTLTKKDTLHLVARIGYDKHDMPLDGVNSRYPIPFKPWSELGKMYMAAYDEHVSQYRPRAEERRALGEERRWLASLRAVELSGVKAAEDIKLFRGVTMQDVDRGARSALQDGDVALRDGWRELFAHVCNAYPQSNRSIKILSVNWSRSFICSALQAAWTDFDPQRNFDDLGIVVQANDMEGLADAKGSSGSLRSTDGVDIRTSTDKLATLHARCRENLDAHQRVAPGAKDRLVIYVGDSDTDLECLLAADIGICMQDESLSSAAKKLQSAAVRLGIAMRSIRHLDPDTLDHPCIWVASDFDDILNKLRGFY